MYARAKQHDSAGFLVVIPEKHTLGMLPLRREIMPDAEIHLFPFLSRRGLFKF